MFRFLGPAELLCGGVWLILGVAVQSWLNDESLVPNYALVGAGILLVLGIAGVVLWLVAMSLRRSTVRQLEQADREVIELELSLAEQTARMRMARELQEVAIHSMASILAEADGARYKGEADPAAAVRSATVIAADARSVLADLRRIMAIVRQGEADASPQPAIRTARELFRVMRDAGLDIRFEDIGDRFDLKPGAEVAVFRILQEALSNSLKHGGEGTEVRVTFRWSGEGLNVLIDDDGIRASTRRDGDDPNRVSRRGGYTIDDDAAALTSTPTGPGITEMRERTELFGGVFNAYVVPGVGFSVSAAFPALRSENGVPAVSR
ncbi:sensor histidine kinase [Salinibacterium hongtaonis]|uniref:histidine kinase n=1 Tax=Homoserinimonas hongtaonis TaxID=2079791 RepID=A0A2U1SYX2_9MICO|nr:ATP-binding protein [Salinibacterium hongtaonis]AWB89377.1 ATP-binding protein [Salinibacterium hongtaonis]PWB96825.1 ATP-binding protein [Salinibacterium hongtaonis]